MIAEYRWTHSPWKSVGTFGNHLALDELLGLCRAVSITPSSVHTDTETQVNHLALDELLGLCHAVSITPS